MKTETSTKLEGNQPSVVNIDGLWVHQGTARDDTNWDHVLEDEREERLQALQSAAAGLSQQNL